ncbi:MAG: alcohol dehydrogenase catalytic domain-containing protein [Alicyclobacillus macrosporangiidus]|nr:alcohol dehydrogenase catalytic domain-containing protein [Alicyclobacillus macrosporangiidus]
MKVGYLVETGRVEVREVEEPKVGEGDVLLRVTAAGICGSDIHAYHGTHPFRHAPMVLGHEVAGEVVAVGSAVRDVHVGDRVTVEPQKACGVCVYCRQGAYNLCVTKVMAGVGGWIGSFAEYFVAPEERVYILPGDLDDDLGLLAEPLAVGVHAVKLAGVHADSTVAVLGTGPIGLLAATAAQAANAKSVFCTDVNPFRLGVAREFGLHALNAKEASVENTILSYAPDGCDVVLLTVSSQQALEQALRIVKRGGKVIVVSIFSAPVQIPLGVVQLNEIELKGSNTYTRDDFLTAIKVLQARCGDLTKVITHHVTLEGINEAMEMLTNPLNEALKIVVQP